MQQYNLKLNVKKTEYMEMGPQMRGSLTTDETLQKVTSFRCLWSYITTEEGAQKDVNDKG